jgi:predicted nucleic acid-binding protein
MSAVVVDASAMVDLLIFESSGQRIADRIEHHALHAPAHIDLELLSAFGRIERAGQLTTPEIELRLNTWTAIELQRHALPTLLAGTWSRRGSLRISDAFYVQLATQLDVPLITTDRRLARAASIAEVPG